MKPIHAGTDSKKKLLGRLKPKKFVQKPAGKSGPVEKIIPMITEEPCPTHLQSDCDKCDYYKVTMSPFNREKVIYRMWVGHNCSLSFGPMGMEDWATMIYVAPVV